MKTRKARISNCKLFYFHVNTLRIIRLSNSIYNFTTNNRITVGKKCINKHFKIYSIYYGRYNLRVLLQKKSIPMLKQLVCFGSCIWQKHIRKMNWGNIFKLYIGYEIHYNSILSTILQLIVVNIIGKIFNS